MPFLCSTTLITTIHLLVTLHAVSQNKTVRFVIQMKTKMIDFLTQIKNASLYKALLLRKNPPISSKINRFYCLHHHYSTQFPIIQKPANPYFISPFTVHIKLFQLFIPVTPLSRILLHKKSHTSQCDQSPFLLSQKERQMSIYLILKTLSNDLQYLSNRVKTQTSLGGPYEK